MSETARAPVAGAELCGGRAERLRYVGYRVWYGLPPMRWRRLDWCRVRRLVFVCTGNICRSPYAEARCRELGLAASSFGIRAGAGTPADATGQRVAAGRGIDLTWHRARAASQVPLERHDLVLCFTPAQARAIRASARAAGAQVSLLGLWCRPIRPHLPDPFGHGPGAFVACFGVIDEALVALHTKVSGASGRPACERPGQPHPESHSRA